MMTRINTGDKMPDFVFDTPFASGVKLSEKVQQADKTVLLFLRYYGCTLCQLDIHDYAAAYDRIRAQNAQLMVVMQSPPSTINDQIKESDLPFDIVCDPDMGLYKELELGVASSKLTMISPKELPKFAVKRKRMEQLGLEHGAYEGEEMQLPGYFVLDKDLNILQAHRATTILDMPSVEEMIEKL